MDSRTVWTRRGAEVRVFEHGSGAPLVFLHGISGLLDDWRWMELLGAQHRVYAPELPGFGDSRGEELLSDMLDFALHGWDVVDALELTGSTPVVVGHSLGGMIAAEMAALAPQSIGGLVLVDAFGLWLDSAPVPDLFALLPYELGDVLFSDASVASRLLSGAADGAELEELRAFFVDNARRMGTAGKILFPIPNRGIARRLYRVQVETLVAWGSEDRVMRPAYAERWVSLLPRARAVVVEGAGHMLPYERPDAFAREILGFTLANAGYYGPRQAPGRTS